MFSSSILNELRENRMEELKISIKDNEIICSFCGQTAGEVQKMVSDPTGKVFICDECVVLCHKVVTEEPKPAK